MIPVSQKFFHPISMTLQYTTNSFVANSDLLLTREAEKSHLQATKPPQQNSNGTCKNEEIPIQKAMTFRFYVACYFLC